IGPVDGHNLKELINALKIAKNAKKPIVVHAQTLKGKGYTPAEGHLEQWHGVSPFNPKNAESLAKSSAISPTSLFASTLLDLANKDSSIVGITAAMPSGTGLDKLIKAYPQRFWDVAIAEQHAVTQASALAKEGFKPFVAIYSTFLQRAFDQLIHDVGIMKTPVKFAIDRAGIVGEDGETHQGAFDIAYLNLIPNFVIFAPRDLNSLKEAVIFAAAYNAAPCAFRYPRKSFLLENDIFKPTSFSLGKLEILQEEISDILFIGYGNGVGRAYLTKQYLDKKITLLDLRFIKPLDKEALRNLAKTYKKWFIFSDSAKIGGVGAILSTFLQENNLSINLYSFEYEDAFIPHGKAEEVESKLGLNPTQLAQKISNLL
ncbi:MAG: 1-deoxy-D-xylulose-5-phosphate synthase, partial [Helicobacter sp.]|nr:1-deoxy-D-xylulose-5-phosphate synthase [Helicobacter sp.]